MRLPLIWAALAAALCVPIAAAAASPLLAWRGPVYILAGFAGILALGLMLVQPLLAGGDLTGLSAHRGGGGHSWVGGARGGGGRGPLDHQSSGHDRRPSLHIADAVLPLRGDRHVGHLRRRAVGCTAPAIGT